MALLDDLVPEPIQRWDSVVLSRLRDDSKGETLFFEFKSTHDCDAIEKAVCAFANRLGGFLLLGGRPGVDLEGRVVATGSAAACVGRSLPCRIDLRDPRTSRRDGRG